MLLSFIKKEDLEDRVLLLEKLLGLGSLTDELTSKAPSQ
jgi:hypothetical protein